MLEQLDACMYSSNTISDSCEVCSLCTPNMASSELGLIHFRGIMFNMKVNIYVFTIYYEGNP